MWYEGLFTAANLITVVGFLATAFLVYVVVQAVLFLQRDPIRERLAAMSTNGSATGPRLSDGALAEGLARQIPLTRLDNGMLDKELRKAGFYRPTARREFLAMRNLMIIAIVIATLALVVVIGPEVEWLVVRVLVAGFCLAALAWALPRLVLRIRGRRRAERVRRGLPDALDIMTMSLAGGLPLRESMTRVSREIYRAHPDLAVELLITREQAEMLSVGHSFQRFADRVDVPEIGSLAAIVGQGQRLGTDIVTSIREFADGMREKRRQLADEKSGKASIKLLFPFVLCLVPAIFLVLWGPALMRLYEFLQQLGGTGTANFE